MKTLLKLMAVAVLAAAVVAYLTSRRGAETRDRLTGYAKEAADLVGSSSLRRATGGMSPSPQPADDEALRSKIEETRQRLHDQLQAQQTSRPGTPV